MHARREVSMRQRLGRIKMSRLFSVACSCRARARHISQASTSKAKPLTMSHITFHLFSTTSPDDFLAAIRALPGAERPLYVGHCEHWIHMPTLSVAALTGTGDNILDWHYLLAIEGPAIILPEALKSYTLYHWAVTANISTDSLAALASDNLRRRTQPAPPLLDGWSPTDHSALAASTPPADLEASLALSSVPLGHHRLGSPIGLQTFIPAFGNEHRGPVSMFNLLAYLPGQRARYFEYIAAFTASVGSRYGGEPQFLGTGVMDWSSRVEEGSEVASPEKGGSEVWEDAALVWYPSLWHFGKMLDDPDYADVDRRFKQGALRDNPLIMCTEVEI